MRQCPNCQSEVKPEERFCGNCGARLPEQPPPGPSRPTTGKETVILSSVPDLPPQPPTPGPDKTMIAGPSPIPPSQFPPAAGPQQLPTTPIAPPPAGGYQVPNLPGANLPPGSVVPPPKSGSNIWKILGIIAAIGVVACVALGVGGFLVFRRLSDQATNVISTAAAAGISTVEAFPTPEELATLTAFATPEALATSAPEPTIVEDPTVAPIGNTGSGSTVLLRDDFENPSNSSFDEGETDNAIYKFVDGTYTVQCKQPKLILWQTVRGDYGNAAFSVDTTLDGPQDSATGLIFHYQDDKNFYIFTVAGDSSYSLDMYKDDQLTKLIDWTNSPIINGPGQLNSLRVETEGDTIRLFANDKLLDEISDATFTRGKTAIAVNTFDDPNLTVTFDNLIIQAIK